MREIAKYSSLALKYSLRKRMMAFIPLLLPIYMPHFIQYFSLLSLC